jgi:hypothetical protein
MLDDCHDRIVTTLIHFTFIACVSDAQVLREDICAWLVNEPHLGCDVDRWYIIDALDRVDHSVTTGFTRQSSSCVVGHNRIRCLKSFNLPLTSVPFHWSFPPVP